MESGGSSGGKFYSKKFVSSTTVGPDGRPVKESYQTKAQGVYGRDKKPEIVERKQTYQHTGTGLEKAAHERMYQGKGRKVVYENDRSTGSQNSYNYYKGMRDTEGADFDREWEGAANRLGLNSDMKSLAYGSGQVKPYKKSSTQAYYDDNARGVYVDSRKRNPNMPVEYREREDARHNHIDRLYPADPSGRMDIPRNTGGKFCLYFNFHKIESFSL